MEIADVIEMRKRFESKYGTLQGVQLRLDNDVLVDGRKDFLFWEDKKGFITWVRRSTDGLAQRDKPYEVHTCDYGQIQEMWTELNQEAFEAMIRKVDGCTEQNIKAIESAVIIGPEEFADTHSKITNKKDHDVRL